MEARMQPQISLQAVFHHLSMAQQAVHTYLQQHHEELHQERPIKALSELGVQLGSISEAIQPLVQLQPEALIRIFPPEAMVPMTTAVMSLNALLFDMLSIVWGKTDRALKSSCPVCGGDLVLGIENDKKVWLTCNAGHGTWDFDNITVTKR